MPIGGNAFVCAWVTSRVTATRRQATEITKKLLVIKDCEDSAYVLARIFLCANFWYLIDCGLLKHGTK